MMKTKTNLCFTKKTFYSSKIAKATSFRKNSKIAFLQKEKSITYFI